MLVTREFDVLEAETFEVEEMPELDFGLAGICSCSTSTSSTTSCSTSTSSTCGCSSCSCSSTSG